MDDLDGRINDCIILGELGEISLDLARRRGDFISAPYDEDEMVFWLRAADYWHKQAYDRALDRREWHERYGV